jgi:hypothetical protein
MAAALDLPVSADEVEPLRCGEAAEVPADAEGTCAARVP